MQHNLATVERRAEDLVRTIGIPPCPRILTDIVREMGTDEPDFPKIGALISADVGLAASMLKTVNSPYYGMPVKATSVQKALALMGLRNVAQLVTALLLRQAFPSDRTGIMEGFWEASTKIATVTAHLARQIKGIDRDEVYTFGLFRDCGFPVMLQAFADYPQIYEAADKDDAFSPDEFERDTLGIDHADIGASLAASWHLPQHICLAIRWHHDLKTLRGERKDVPPPSSRLIALALVAEYAYRNRNEPESFADWTRLGDAALACSGLSADNLPRIIGEVRELLAAG